MMAQFHQQGRRCELNNEQWMTLLRQVLTAVGTIVGLIGWMNAGEIATWTDRIMQLAGTAAPLISIVWSILARSKTSMVTAVAKLPEVKAVQLEPTAEGQKLNDNTPSNVKIAA